MRKYELDFLRIFACLLVIVSHLTCLVVFDINYSQWRTANIFYVARNACVPLFFSITGILLLKKEDISYRVLIWKVVKFIFIYIVFCTFFYVIRRENGISLSIIISDIIPGMLEPSHLWYIGELIGIYLFIPVLIMIAKNIKLCRYFLAVWFVFMFGFTFIENNLSALFLYTNIDFINSLIAIMQSFHIPEFCTYSGYLLLGYYLYYVYDKKIRISLLLFMLSISIVLPATINWYCALKFGNYIGAIWDYNSVSSLIQAICYLLITKEYITKISLQERGLKILTAISGCTFGIYLIHPIFTERFFRIMVSGNILYTIPGLSLCIFMISLLVVMVYRYVKKSILYGANQFKRYICSTKLYKWDVFLRLWSKDEMNDNTNQIIKNKYILFLIIVLARAVIIIICNGGMYADGTDSFMHVLQTESLYLWAPPRQMTMAVTRIFQFLLLKLNVTNFRVLAYAYSFGCVFWVTIFVICSLFLCYKFKSEKLLNHTIILWTLIFTFSGMYTMHESLLTASILWFIFVCVYHIEYLVKYKGWIIFLIITLIFCLGGTYESFGIMGPVILVFLLVNKVKGNINFKNKKYVYLVVMLLILINSILELYYILNPILPDAKNGFISTLFKQDWRLICLLFGLALFLVFSEIIINRYDLKIMLIIEIFISILFTIYMICDTNRIVYYCRDLHSMFNFFIPLAFIIYEMILLLNQPKRICHFNILIILLSFSCLIAVSGTNIGYSNYLKHLNSITSSNSGFIVWDEMNSDDVYNTDWTVPNESILASKFYGNKNTIGSIIVQKEESIYYQPYDMWNINSYFNLSKYEIEYDLKKFK